MTSKFYNLNFISQNDHFATSLWIKTTINKRTDGITSTRLLKQPVSLFPAVHNSLYLSKSIPPKKSRCNCVISGTVISLSKFTSIFCSILSEKVDRFSLLAPHFKFCDQFCTSETDFVVVVSSKFIWPGSLLFCSLKGVLILCVTLFLNRCKISFFAGKFSDAAFSMLCSDVIAISTVCFSSLSGFSSVLFIPDEDDSLFMYGLSRWSLRKHIKGMFSMSKSLHVILYFNATESLEILYFNRDVLFKRVSGWCFSQWM